MGMIEELLGDESRRQKIEDFIARYEKGPPEEGISDDESKRHYDELTRDLPEDEYREAASDAFGRMSSEQRREIAEKLRTEARAEGVSVDESEDEDAGMLGKVAAALRGGQSGGLGQMLDGGGSGSGGVLSSPAARAALAGIAAHVAKRFLKR
ncbi:hypothetical protein BH20ACT14_BH20ACT14_05380 [soil metagenome]|nr:hypothetical protein [Actinomycetota bacterium]MDQ3426135.1 hypothetical protein [Actinomycetota bacterium]